MHRGIHCGLAQYMLVSITDPVRETIIFGILLCTAFLLTYRTKKHFSSFAYTQELKGFAILTIVFAHIGYYLASDTRYLFPLSILAGVGVNLFFFLSGYGLSLSQLKKNERPLHFYARRLRKLFVPLWIVLSAFVFLDAVLLHKTYGLFYIVKAYLGIFTSADLYTDINAPFWYFTLILIYYLLFPLLFNRKRLWLTALLFFVTIFLLVKINLPFLYGVIGLYRVHMYAFPLGIFVAYIVSAYPKLLLSVRAMYRRYSTFIFLPLMLALAAGISYFAIHSNVGGPAYLEEDTSLFTMLLVLLFFLVKKRESQLFGLFGLYSYEIYLFHWPLMYRYDVLFAHLPAGIANALYFGVFLLLARGLQEVTDRIIERMRHIPKKSAQ